MINVRFKYGCAWVRLPHGAFPHQWETLNLYFGSSITPQIGTANGWLSTSWRFDSAMRYCADTQQRCRYSSTNTGWKVPGGHCVLVICRSAKKGASPLPIHFLALISTFAYQRLIPARTTYRG